VKNMSRRIALFAVLAAAMAAGPLVDKGSPQEARPQARPLQHDAVAIGRLLAVRVLGPEGRPLTGLRKEDFSLFEDGQPKPITEFEVHTMTEAGLTTSPDVPLSEEAAALAAEASRRKLFVLLDLQGSDRAGQVKAKTVALDFLDSQVHPGDQVAVIVWYAMSGFAIREYLTSDLDRIRRAIEDAAEAPPSASEPVRLASEEPEARDRGVSMPAGERSPEIRIAPAEGLGQSVIMVPGTGLFQRTDFIPRLTELAETFKTIPGHKSLVLFTARNMGAAARRLGRLFAAAGTAVYAINTQDWKMGFFGTKFKYIWTEHSLDDMAAASGGKYFADINDAAAIVRDVQGLSGNYYVIGYYVHESWEGTFHPIRVDVARPGARVLVQEGFSDSKPFNQMSDFEKDVQLLDLLWSERPYSGNIPLMIDPLIVCGTSYGLGCLLCRWAVGSKTGPPAAAIEVSALLRDGAGNVLISRKWNVDLAPHDGQTVWAYMTHRFQIGPHDLRLVVRDHTTGTSLIGRARFQVAARAPAGISLSSPLLIEDGPAASFLRLVTARPESSKNWAAAEEPSILDLYRLLPKEGSPIVGRVLPGAMRLLAVVPVEMGPHPSEEMPVLAVEAKLVASAPGVEIPLEAEIRNYTAFDDGPDIMVLLLTLPDVAPGDYDLDIMVEDVGTDRRASVRKTLIFQ